MRVLITGVCGYVGSRLVRRWADAGLGWHVIGIDNLSRRGSETNIKPLKRLGVDLVHADLRSTYDVVALPHVDWVVDCAANPSVTAGIDKSGFSSAQIVENNLIGTIHLVEHCRRENAGFVLLSTSRVYSVEELNRIPLREGNTRYVLETPLPVDMRGLSESGISEGFSTMPPISIYGATKLASELVALEYGGAFGFPVWVNRCAVIGGPGQFGKIDQGIFSYWVYSHALGRDLAYIGYNGSGKQVRDVILAEDIADLVSLQIKTQSRPGPRVFNVGGGNRGSMSLQELTTICLDHFGRKVRIDAIPEARAYDIPYYVTDNSRVVSMWNWRPSRSGEELVRELCEWTKANIDIVEKFMC